MKTLAKDQYGTNDRILAWLNEKPYEEFSGQRRPKVPNLSPRMVIRTYTPPNADHWEQFFTPLEGAMKALELVNYHPGWRILDPCAGIGNLILACREMQFLGPVTAIEIEEQAHRIGSKLFPQTDWRCGNAFDFVDHLPGGGHVVEHLPRFGLVVCNPPFGGGQYLRPQNSTGWLNRKTEHLFAELAGKVLHSGGQGVFIAPRDSYRDMVLPPGLDYDGPGDSPLPGDFLQTSVRVYAHYFTMR